MKNFKDVIYFINRTFGCLGFGMAIGSTITGNFIRALVLLFIVSTLFIVGYFTEKWSN